MKFAFEKSKYPVKRIAFWTLIIFSLFSIFSIFRMYKYNFEVKNLNSVLKPITLNIEFNKTTDTPLLFCFNSYCAQAEADPFYNVYSYRFDKDDPEFYKEITKTIYFSFLSENKNLTKYMNNLTLYMGNDRYYYNHDEIQKFSSKEFKIETKTPDGKKETQNYLSYKIPFEKDNYSGIFNHICVLFLSLFYSANLFIIPYFWLFFAFCIYYFNKEEFNFKFNLDKKKASLLLFSILLLGTILRIDNLLYYPLWSDEVYTKVIALENFKTCFLDPGNPPLFFLFEKIITSFSNSDFMLRLLPFVFGIGFIYAVYFVFSKINQKFALFSSFLAAISTINIYYSQEARGYTLSMFLSVLSIYLLNKFLDKKDLKSLIIYSIVVILSINNNYMLIVLMFSNFIWGLGCLIAKKSQFKGFIFANIISAITFLPYFYVSSKIALNGSFNGWIEPLDFKNIQYIINNYFINGYVFLALFGLLALVLFLNYVFKKENRTFYLQINFILILTVALIALISVFVKPIMHKRTLMTLWGILFLLESASIYFIYTLKTKIKLFETIKIFFLICLVVLCFKMNSPIPTRELCRLDDFSHFVQNDLRQYKDFEIHLVVPDNKNYYKQYPSLYNNKNIIWHFMDVNSGNYLKSIKKKDYIKENKKAILYTNAIGIEVQNVLFLNPKARYYKTNSVGNIKFIYD